MELNLTDDKIFKTIVRFSLPFLCSYFLQTLYGMADLYMIGQFCGVESTTAVSIGSQVMHMLTVMVVGLAMGAVVVIGQYMGAEDKERVSLAIGNTVTLFAVLSAGLTVLLLFLVHPVVRWMATPPEAAAGTGIYLGICFLGIPFIIGYNVISSVLRAMGDSKSPMYFIAVACALNIAADYILIGKIHLGEAGAALGTVFSQSFSFLLAVFVVSRRKQICMMKKNLHPQPWLMRKILKIGIPVALQEGFIQISFIVVTIFANLRGVEDAAAVGIVEKMIGMLFLLPSAMMQTVSTMSAQNIGAGKQERAKKTLEYASVICVLWGFLAVTLMNAQSEKLIGLFSNHRETVIMGTQYMKSYVWDCVFAGIHFCFSGYFCAYGFSALSFLHNALSIFLVRIPFSYMAARYFPDTLFPMGLASTAGSLFSVLICLIAYYCLKKKKLLEGSFRKCS